MASHHFPAPFIIIIPSSPESQDDHLGRLRANPRQWRPTLVGQSIECEEPIWDFLVDYCSRAVHLRRWYPIPSLMGTTRPVVTPMLNRFLRRPSAS